MRSPSALLLPLTLILSSCAGQGIPSDAPRAPVTADIEAWSDEMPIADPWLREQLPAAILSYQRIPNPLALMAIPKGSMLDTALGSEANILNFLGIRAGLADNLAADSPLFADPRYQLIVRHLSSPIEIAAMGLPQPSVLIGMTLDLRSNAELEALFGDLGRFPPLPGLAGPIDGEGYGQLAAPLPVFLHFEAETGRLALYGGPAATRTAFAGLLDAAADAPAHPMAALEAQIDESGQGFFGWVDATQALGMAALAMPPEAMQMLRVTGLNQLRALAYGAGVADSKGRLKLVADVGTDRANRPFPVIDNRISATAVGDPRGLFVLSIPSPEEFARLETLAFSYFPPEIREQWAALKGEFASLAGASIEEILSAIGPELLAFSDAAGNYTGIRVRDQALLDDVLGRLTASAGVEIEQRRVDGQTIRYVSLRGAPDIPEDAGMPPQAAAVLGAIGRMRTRFFWIEDGDYLYIAGMPQLLMDRGRLGADTSIGNWLARDQHVNLSNAFIGATGTVAHLPRTLYQIYLGMMQGIADVADVEYDIWSMPTASELGLPERGTLGFSFNLGEPYLSLELTYESHPAEILLAGGGGLAAVAAAGIVAAVALPAYQDYTIRAQVSEGFNMVAAPRAAVAETWRASREAPADRLAAGMTPTASDTSGKFVASVAISDGEIIVRYGNDAHAAISGRQLVFTPYRTPDDSIQWVCGHAEAPALEPIGGRTAEGTTIPAEYLPSGCR